MDISIESRLRGMLWGALLGDAAALGAHWYYRQEDLAARFPEGIRGFETPQADHYHRGKQSGDFTLYGDALEVLLDSVIGRGQFDHRDFGARFMRRMTPGNYEGYVDGATRKTYERYRAFIAEQEEGRFDFQQGADDDQLAGATSLMPVVALFHSSEDLFEQIETFVRVRQDNAEAIAFCQFQAAILSQLLSGVAPGQAVHEALALMESRGILIPVLPERSQVALLAVGSRDFVETTRGLGNSCPLVGSFPAALYSFLDSLTLSYEDAILRIIRAGGESAGRAMLAGAWLGAYRGESFILETWKDRLADRSRVEAKIDALVRLALEDGRQRE